MRWQVIDDDVRRAEYWQMRAGLLEGGLEAFERAVAYLVGGDDLDAVLPRVIEAAARAVPAPVFVLALNGSQRVYAEGVAGEAADALAVQLLAGDVPADGSWLVTDVVSTRDHYGRLAAIHHGASFFPQERALLEAFGRLAAAALDSAAAVEEVRRQAQASDTLLGLASTLAEPGTVEELAARVARAIPAIVDCDRAVVAIAEPDGRRCRVAGMTGFSPEEAVALDGQCFVIGEDKPQYRAMTVHVAGSPTPGSGVEAALDMFGSAAGATFPITSSGRVVGWIAISVDRDASRLTDNRELADRLRGLAGQAATAISNARLLDQVRHQALHDALTGLPNRALILDRAEHLLQRAHRDGSDAAALFIDLDNFKTINDTLGHRAGDELGTGRHRHITDEHDELVPAEPSDRVAAAEDARDARGDGLEQFVAGAVAEGVVDRLEVVEVDEQGRRLAVVARDALQQVLGTVEDQGPVLGQVVAQVVEDRVVAQAGGEADIGGVAVHDWSAVEDERHPGFQRPVGRKELVGEADAPEGGAVAEPGEGQVEPVVDALVEQPAPHPRRRLALGHPGFEPGADGLGAPVGEALHLAEALEVCAIHHRET